MKLLLALAAVLALALAAPEKTVDDSAAPQAEPKDLQADASALYSAHYPPSQRPPLWNTPGYVHPSSSHPNSPPTWAPPQNTYPTQKPWNIPHHHVTTVGPAVIKNEQHFYDNGAYRYEYQIADGTHVGEEGYFTSPNREPGSLVKRGWYSFVGANGKTYTVTYYADKTGFHPYGAHLPNTHYVSAVPYSSEGEKFNDYKPIHDHEHDHDYYTTKAPEHGYYPTQTPGYVPPLNPTYPPHHIDHYPSPQPPHYYHYSK